MVRAPAPPLTDVVLRPATLAVAATLLLLITSSLSSEERWLYGLVVIASFMGLWESGIGVYRLLRAPWRKRAPGRQLQISTLWLISTVANLALLNTAVQFAFPDTFEWRGRPASALDVAYMTLLTFTSTGYGDVLPATPVGKLLSMLTSFAGLSYATAFFAALWQQVKPDGHD